MLKNYSVENLRWYYSLYNMGHTEQEEILWQGIVELSEMFNKDLYKPTTLKQLLYGN